jgi:hypothetical protein
VELMRVGMRVKARLQICSLVDDGRQLVESGEASRSGLHCTLWVGWKGSGKKGVNRGVAYGSDRKGRLLQCCLFLDTTAAEAENVCGQVVQQ